MAELRATTDLDTVRGFLNTLDPNSGEDALTEPAGLAAWLTETGLATAGTPVDAGDLRRARSLRATLRRSAEANHDGDDAPDLADDLTRLSGELAVGVRFGPAGAVELWSAADGVAGALGTILAAVAAGVADGRWQRVKLCRSDECGWAFYDGSRNRSGRWCDMSACGNREKVRAYRRRHAGGDAATR